MSTINMNDLVCPKCDKFPMIPVGAREVCENCGFTED